MSSNPKITFFVIRVEERNRRSRLHSMSPESALLSIRDEPIEHKGGSLSS
jgi:hypothetical protein